MAGTETFNYTATYLNGFYNIYEALNSNLVLEFPVAGCNFTTHPSLVNLFYMGNINPILLDYTKCTNQTPSSRQNLIDILVGLAVSPSVVSVSGGTLTSVGTVTTVTTVGSVTTLPPITIASLPTATSIGNPYGLSYTSAASANLASLRIDPTATGKYLVLANIVASSSVALSSGISVAIQYNPTVTGGTWATPASVPGSNIQQNLTGTVTVGSRMLVLPFNTSQMFNVISYNFKILAGVPFTLILTQTGIGSSTVAINWIEN